MAKGPKLPPEVIHIIADVYLEHSEWKAEKIQREVHNRLQKENLQRKPGWPGLSSVQKELADLRRKEKNRPFEHIE